MRERGQRGPVGVAALNRLLQLLGVAEQHEAAGRERRSEHIGERHLPSLVHEQHIDCLAELLPRPEPAGSSYQLDFLLRDRLCHRGIRVDLLNARVRRVGLPRHLLQGARREALFCRGLYRRVEEVTDDFMTEHGDTHCLPGARKVADHAGAGVGFAGPWWPLNWQHAPLELGRERTRRRERAR